MAKESEWRVRARIAIERALASCPKLASVEDRRLVVSRAYPFGQRSGWAYHCWRDESRKALDLLEIKERKTFQVYYAVDFPSARWRKCPKFWITVRCEWCGNGRLFDTKGCLACGEKVNELETLLADPMFMGLLRAARDRKHPGPISDWLMENGHQELYERFWDIFQRMESV